MLTAGQYSVQKNGQIICINCVSVWTNYTARQMTQHAHQEIKSLCDEPWAMVFNTLQWELGTPDIWLPITKLMQWSAMKKQKRIAIVYKKRLHLIMLLRILV